MPHKSIEQVCKEWTEVTNQEIVRMKGMTDEEARQMFAELFG